MPPDLLFSFLLGATYGTVFHLWRGKNIRDLAIYFFSVVAGFMLGQMLGNLLGFSFFLIGPLHVLEATLVSWITLFIIHWLKI
jgi:hypothetical protein